MKTGTSFLLLSLCVISSALGDKIESDNSANNDPPSVQEFSLQSENSTDALPDNQVYSSACPGGWDQYDQRCFKFIDSRRSWPEAERYCLLLGGNLASVHSISEHYFIQGLIVTQTQGSPVTWIGGSDAQQEGIWFWSDGSRLGFTHWKSGEPNNHNSNEQCLHMNYGGGLHWNDWRCSDAFPSVCVRTPAA